MGVLRIYGLEVSMISKKTCREYFHIHWYAISKLLSLSLYEEYSGYIYTNFIITEMVSERSSGNAIGK